MSISGRSPRVMVIYDCRKTRARRVFDNAYEARRFYVAKDKAGKNPEVKKCD